MKRLVFFGILLILVVRAHGNAATAVPAAGADKDHTVVLNNSATPRASNPSTLDESWPAKIAYKGENAPAKFILSIPETVLEMSEPASLTLLGLVLLSLVGITRRLPNYLRERQIKIRAAWEVLSGFFL